MYHIIKGRDNVHNVAYTGETKSRADEFEKKLVTVNDPELGIDIVNLGLLYGVDLNEEGLCQVTMTLTTMGCPLAHFIEFDIKEALQELNGVEEVVVSFVFDPPWTTENISEYGRIALGAFYGDY